MNAAAPAWHGVGTLRDKVVLVQCHGHTFGFEARYVRQVGLAEMVTNQTLVRDEFAAHVGHGFVGNAPCSLWDLGQLLGIDSDDRSLIALERPGGLIGFRCGQILAVEPFGETRRHAMPFGLSPRRPGLFKAALALPTADGQAVAWLFRASALLDRNEIQRAQQDWRRASREA
jgi:hypothetical protein